MGDIEASRKRIELPKQAGPVHENAPHLADSGRPPELPAAAHWSERARSQHVAGVVLALTSVGFLACLGVTIVTRSVPAAVALGCCLLGVIVIRTAMMSADRTTVDLRGPLLTVEHDGAVHTIDLAGSYRIIETHGDPDSKKWRFLAETDDMQVLELGPREVDPRVIEAAVRYYREVANGKHSRPDPINWRG